MNARKQKMKWSEKEFKTCGGSLQAIYSYTHVSLFVLDFFCVTFFFSSHLTLPLQPFSHCGDTETKQEQRRCEVSNLVWVSRVQLLESKMKKRIERERVHSRARASSIFVISWNCLVFGRPKALIPNTWRASWKCRSKFLLSTRRRRMKKEEQSNNEGRGIEYVERIDRVQFRQ